MFEPESIFDKVESSPAATVRVAAVVPSIALVAARLVSSQVKPALPAKAPPLLNWIWLSDPPGEVDPPPPAEPVTIILLLLSSPR